MSDAPERIWISPEAAEPLNYKLRYFRTEEYIRADIAEARIAELEAALRSMVDCFADVAGDCRDEEQSRAEMKALDDAYTALEQTAKCQTFPETVTNSPDK